jgi:chromosome segregation ATPase
VPAAVAAIRAKLDFLDKTSDACAARCSPLPAEISAIVARLDAMDRATDLMHADYSRVPTDLDRRAAQLEQMVGERCAMLQKQHDTLQKYADTRDDVIRRAADELRNVFNERFRAVDLRFSERDLRFAQIDIDHQKAIEAALATVNNASEKNERSFTKQIDSLQAASIASQASMQARIDDLKERLSEHEGATKGFADNRNWGATIIMATAALATVAVAAYNVIMMARH